MKINLDCVVERWEKEAEAELEAEDSSGSEESCRTERDSEMLIEQTNPILYERGKIADTFYLILSGHV